MANKAKNEIKKIKKEWKNILFNLLFAVFTLLFPILFKKNILLTFLLVVLISIIGLVKWKSGRTLIIFIFGGVFGAVAEIIAVDHNVWSYSYTNFINIPLWLFIVWGNASAFIYQTSVEIKKLGIKK
ncbi:Uncharacterised protein [uncultured archaeon]|nr:Uncharacterised protein [uncultured archaeon]